MKLSGLILTLLGNSRPNLAYLSKSKSRSLMHLSKLFLALLIQTSIASVFFQRIFLGIGNSQIEGARDSFFLRFSSLFN